MIRFFAQFFVCGCILTWMASFAVAQHAGDIDLSIEDLKIVTNERVYGVELGETVRYFSNEPGYDAIPGIFHPGVSVGFDILGSLKVWNGTDFSTTAIPRLLINYDLDNYVLTPTTDIFTTGLNVNTNVGNGEWHQHFGMTLRNSSGSALDSAPDPLAEIGVYLLSLQLRTNQSGIETSLPFYLVFNNGDSESNHDAAIAYQTQVAAVPEPGTWAILVCCLGISCWAGRQLRRGTVATI